MQARSEVASAAAHTRPTTLIAPSLLFAPAHHASRRAVRLL
jgi:hypothetical protein